MKRFRETRLGRYVTQAQAQADPAGTVAETVSDAPETIAALRWRIEACEARMLGAASELRLAYTPEKVAVVVASLERVARDRIPEEHAA